MAISADRDRGEWLAERKSGIGGSDAAAVLGLNPFMSPLELFEDKRAEVVIDEQPTGPMLRGIYLEPVAAELYKEKTGRNIRKQPLRRHREHEFMIANVDRQIMRGGDRSEFYVDETGTLEIKCPGLSVMSKVKAHGLPDYMIVQLMHYLGVLGYEWGSFCLFNAERWDIIHFDLEADQEFIGSLVEAEEEFWMKYVLTGTPPPENGAAVPDVPEVKGELSVVDGEEWRKAAEVLQEARELVAAAGELEDSAKADLQAMMTTMKVEAIEIPEFLRIYWRYGKPKVSWKSTAAALAEAGKLKVNDYKVTGKASRSFSPYFLKRAEE